MADVIPTIRVKPWSEDQGDFVEINAEDFDPAVHQHFGEMPAPDPFDHDGDGKPGGSVKRAAKRKARK